MIAVGDTDQLVLYCYNDEAGASIRLNYRLRLPDGSFQNFADTHTPSTDRSESTKRWKLVQGDLLSATLQQTTTAVSQGRSFVRLGINYQGVGVREHFINLCQGYLQGLMAICYPTGPVGNPLDDRGYWTSVKPSNPAAGASATLQASAGLFRRYEAVQFELVTAVAAANRLPYVAWRDASNVELGRSIAGAVQTASLTVTYVFGLGLYPLTSPLADFVIGPLPTIYLPDDYDMTVGVQNVQAADQLQNVRWKYREWVIPWAV